MSSIRRRLRLPSWRAMRSPVLALADQGVFAATNLMLQIVLARAVGSTEFGIYSVGSTFFFMAAIVHQTFIVEPMFVFGERRFGEQAGAYYRSLRRGWSIWFGLLILAAGLLLALIAWMLGARAIAEALAAFALVSPFILYLWLLRRLSFALGRIDVAVLAGVAYAVVLIVGAAILLTMHLMTVQTGILLQGIAAGVGSGVVMLVMNWPASQGTPPATLGHHLQYGRWAFGGEVVNWLIQNGPLLLLPIWFGLNASALLRVTNLIFMPLLQVTSAFASLMLRRFSSAQAIETPASAAVPYFWQLLGGAAVYAAITVAIGPFAVPSVFGASYPIDHTVLVLAGLSISLFVASQAFFVAMRAGERSREVMLVHLLVLAVILAMTPMITMFGLVGVFSAQIVAWSIGAVAAARVALRSGGRQG